MLLSEIYKEVELLTGVEAEKVSVLVNSFWKKVDKRLIKRYEIKTKHFRIKPRKKKDYFKEKAIEKEKKEILKRSLKF